MVYSVKSIIILTALFFFARCLRWFGSRNLTRVKLQTISQKSTIFLNIGCVRKFRISLLCIEILQIQFDIYICHRMILFFIQTSIALCFCRGIGVPIMSYGASGANCYKALGLIVMV